MKVEVSNGEIIDRLTILMIKLEKINDENKLVNIRKEYEVVAEAAKSILSLDDPLVTELYNINSKLWDIENHIRDLERRKDFGEDFVNTARSVYFTNDRRAEIKREINLKTSSGLLEEKLYNKY
ncbi:MAG TPA: DUF6165 family protein [Bacteroidales bacterium]|nr:DUF6165 family protein [Bacteroidales bacterium]HQG37359.1 DUF6165 family protein [Bacteroidales bacterium]HQG52763.1 DUF6165 family protein [Bacteroidales bacterium]HQJ20785.1 DUF6165 family protein [Bacteroidales bacterium]